MKITKKNIVCVGGGTGTSVVSSGLKKYPVNFSVIVSMSDSGGCNQRIREEFGFLPFSDIRQCFVALMDDNTHFGKVFHDLFDYRFNKGSGITGMTFGNLFLAALSDIFKSEKEAIDKTGEILNIFGRVLPVTLSKTDLVAIYENGEKIIGEHFIDEPEHDGEIKIKEVLLKPFAKANSEAIKAILDADLIIFGPGDLYTSLIPNLLVKGIKEALNKTQAKLVYVLNLTTRYGQTFNFTAKDHVTILEKYLGKKLDFILVNSAPIPKNIINNYKKEKSIIVVDDLKNVSGVVKSDLLNRKKIKRNSSDILKRSLIHHDAGKLAKVIISLCKH